MHSNALKIDATLDWAYSILILIKLELKFPIPLRFPRKLWSLIARRLQRAQYHMEYSHCNV